MFCVCKLLNYHLSTYNYCDKAKKRLKKLKLFSVFFFLSRSRKLLNTDSKRIGIHNTALRCVFNNS